MIDGTIDADGSVRPRPGSTARFSVTASRDEITVTSRDDRIIVLNGDGVACHGQGRFFLLPGRSHTFAVAAETVGSR